MSYYLTRIELHKAVFPDDYNILHTAMLAKGFTHFINSSEGDTYELPTAEYFINSSSTIDEIYNLAIQAAKSVGKTYWIITTEFLKAKMELKLVKKRVQ